MAYKLRTRICRVCGRPFTGRLPPAAAVRCFDCGWAAAETNMRQMAAKSGNGYDQWLRSNGPRGRPRKI